MIEHAQILLIIIGIKTNKIRYHYLSVWVTIIKRMEDSGRGHVRKDLYLVTDVMR